MEFLKAGDGMWVARSGAYVVIRDNSRAYRVLDGYGYLLSRERSFGKAKEYARKHAARH